jgi:hypothetical protein
MVAFLGSSGADCLVSRLLISFSVTLPDIVGHDVVSFLWPSQLGDPPARCLIIEHTAQYLSSGGFANCSDDIQSTIVVD